MSKALCGVFAPVVTPFKSDLSVDADLFVRHSRWLMSQGAGLAIFGTNSEANSLSVTERQQLLERLVQDGLDPARMLPGTGCCSITDTVALTRHAVDIGCAGALMLPPFYYKGVSDDGLYRYYAEIIARVASPKLKLYLYHIPAFTGVPITLTLIERLIKDFPDTVVGIKDSSGDWSNIEAMLKAFPGFAIFRHRNHSCRALARSAPPAAFPRLPISIRWRSIACALNGIRATVRNCSNKSMQYGRFSRAIR